ncbi:hypothetical protein FOZ62_015805, partial [Perkinsus olseni]
ENLADEGTRHPLLQRILSLREELDAGNLTSATTTAADDKVVDGEAAHGILAVRKRSDGSHDEQPLRRSTRKKKRVDYRERDEDDFGDDDDADKANGQEEAQEVDGNAQIRNIYSYDYHGLDDYPPLVRHYVVKLLESGRADVEKLKVIDDECKLILAQAAHGLAHDSVESALLQLRRHFEWDNMKDMVKQVIASCQVCAATSVKAGDRMFKQEAEIPKLVDEPFYRVNMDVVGPYEGRFYA